MLTLPSLKAKLALCSEVKRLSKYERLASGVAEHPPKKPDRYETWMLAEQIVALCRDRDCRTSVNSLPGVYVKDIEEWALRIMKASEEA